MIMSEPGRILSGLKMAVGNIELTAVIDEATRTARIVQTGEPLNGEAAAIEAVRALLIVRVKRTRPDLRIEG